MVNVKGDTKMTRHEIAGQGAGLRAIPQTDVNLSLLPTETHFSHDPEKANVS